MDSDLLKGKGLTKRNWEDFVKKSLTVARFMLEADESPRRVERRIVIRLEPATKKGALHSFFG